MESQYTGYVFEFDAEQQSAILAEFCTLGMKYTSQFFEIAKPSISSRITHAVVTALHVAIDWSELNTSGSLSINSHDGFEWSGTFGCRDESNRHPCSFGLHRTVNGELVLFGRWQRLQDDEPREGCWVIQLIRMAE